MTLIAETSLWEYQVVANETPADPGALVVPTADWLGPAPAPFGNSGLSGSPDPGTDWELDTGLWLRRGVELDGTSQMVLRGRVENACYVFFDGVYVGSYNPENDQLMGIPEWIVVVPLSLCTEGTHTVALLCLDEENANGSSTTFITISADYLPILMPYQPRAPMRETLSWLTDVLVAKDGSEERTQMRLMPRQILRMTYPLGNENMRGGLNLVYGRRHDQWTIPVWSQAQYVGAVAQGAFSVTAEPDYYDYREGGYALLWQSPTQYQVLAVGAASGSSIDFYNLADEFTDAWIMPARVGFIPENPRKELTGHRSEFEITFQVEDNVALNVSAPTQYLGQDIYYDETLLSGDTLSDDIVGQLDLHDEDLGVVSYYAPWIYTRVARTHRVLAETPAEAWALRQWLYRRAGRTRGFWQPSFEDDLRHLNTSTITTQLLVEPDGYLEHATDRSHIAVQTRSGWLPRAITAAALTSPGILQLTLNSSLATNPKDILRICWLGFKRLNTDSVELNWPGAGLCEMDVRLLELNP